MLYANAVRDTSVRKKQFTGVWDARRLLYELLLIAKSVKDEKIELYATESTDDTYKIRCKRIISVINAFRGCKIIQSSSDPILLSVLVTEDYSESKISEMVSLIEGISPIIYKKCIGNAFSKDNIYSSREQLFSLLFEYRFETYKLFTRWKGVYGKNIGGVMAIDITQRLYNEKIESINDKLDRFLLSLLGDEFDKILTEIELIDNYDYPDVTEEELYNEYCIAKGSESQTFLA